MNEQGTATERYLRSEAALEARGVCKVFGRRTRRGGAQTMALDRIRLAVMPGEFVTIMGPSGSGKSTLLNCLSTIDFPTSGQVLVGGVDITALSGARLAHFRRTQLGFIFQDSNLLDTLTCRENIALALSIQKARPRAIEQRVAGLAETLGIVEVLDKFPYQVSGGQAQRVAAARAMVGRPQIVLADEPTGSLDSKAAAQLLETLELMNRLGSTILMVTHDPTAASHSQRIVFLKDGRIVQRLDRGQMERGAFYRQVVEANAKLGGDTDAD